MSGYELAYVAVAVRDLDAAAHEFSESVGLARATMFSDAAVFGVGRSALALFDVEDPLLGGNAKPGVHHIALAATDPEGMAQKHGLLVTSTGVGLGGAKQVEIAPEATCGIRTRIIEPLNIDANAGGLVECIDHIGVASTDNRAAIETFCDTLGCPLESQQTDIEVRTAIESFTSDKYGVVYHNRPPETVGGLRVAFITVGDCELEFLQNYDPALEAGNRLGDAAGTTGGDKSAIARFVERNGPGLHHLALKTTNIDGMLDRLGAAGHRMIDSVGRPGSRRARIGFIHPQAFGGGLVVHFVERP